MPRKIAFDRISFLPDTENTGSSVFSRKMRPMHRVLFVLQTRDCHWNASVNTRFCQFSLLLFGIQSNHRISIREHSYPSAYKHTKLELRILFLALLFFALSQLYSQNFKKKALTTVPHVWFVHKVDGATVQWQVQLGRSAFCCGGEELLKDSAAFWRKQ